MMEKGQVLVSILILMAVGILALATGIISTSLTRQLSASVQSNKVFYSAETGLEEALIKLLRNPNYAGEIVPDINGVRVEITVTEPEPTKKVIISKAQDGTIEKTVEISADFVNNILTVTSWRQIP